MVVQWASLHFRICMVMHHAVQVLIIIDSSAELVDNYESSHLRKSNDKS